MSKPTCARFASRLNWIHVAGLSGLYGLIVILKLAWVTQAESAFLFGDEYLYKSASQSLARGEGYLVDQAFFVGYPPLYPLLLSPSFLLGGDWYAWMLRLNTLVSSLAIFPVWLIARQLLPVRESWLCTFVAAVLPYHVVFPRIIMSENLFLPLFLFTCYILITNADRGIWRPLAFGSALGLCWLTRHIFSVIAPLMLILWWLRPWFIGQSNFRQLLNRQRFISMGLPVLGLGLTYGIWLAYAYWHSIPLSGAMGVGLSNAHLPGLDQSNLWSALWPWVKFHLATVALMCAPYLGAIFSIPMCFQKQRANERPALYLIILVFSTTAIFSITATVFFWRFFGNRWPEGYLSERYFMYAVPLLPVVGCLTLQRWETLGLKPRLELGIVTTGLALLSLGAAFFTTIDRSQTPSPPFYVVHQAIYSIAFTATYPSPGIFLLICLAVIIFYMFFAIRWPRYAPLVMSVGLIIFYSLNDLIAARDMTWAQTPARHGKVIAQLIRSQSTIADPGNTTIFLDSTLPVNPSTLTAILKFWDVSPMPIVVSRAPDLTDPQARSLWVTDQYFPNSILAYQVSNRTYYVYQLPLARQSNPP